jgi:hypothetical protein
MLSSVRHDRFQKRLFVAQRVPHDDSEHLLRVVEQSVIRLFVFPVSGNKNSEHWHVNRKAAKVMKPSESSSFAETHGEDLTVPLTGLSRGAT